NGGTTQFGASNRPLRGEKDTLWEGGTKTTTIVHAPKSIHMNGIRPQLFHVVDWHATMLAIAGLDIQSYGDGINQWNYIITGIPKLRRFQFVYNIDEHGSAIRDGDFKLILGNPDRRIQGDHGKARLYRITEDPGESNDLSKVHPGIVHRCKKRPNNKRGWRCPAGGTRGKWRFPGDYTVPTLHRPMYISHKIVLGAANPNITHSAQQTLTSTREYT
ncbi:hypothetical protein OSTOST_19821, partial [Ostertagia ostertagi]